MKNQNGISRRIQALVLLILLFGLGFIFSNTDAGQVFAQDPNAVAAVQDQEAGSKIQIHHSNLYPLLFVIFSLIIGVAARQWLRKSPIPYTVSLLLIGLGLGAANRLGWFGTWNLGILQLNMDFMHQSVMWASGIDPHLILFVFLPTLIFEAAFGMDYHTFKKTVGNASILAIPGIIVALLLTALIVVGMKSAGMGFQEWDWALALLFGTVVSATDPVAVVSVLKDLGASKRLSTLIDGESLLNDGTAIVIFSVILVSLTGGDMESRPMLEFFRVALGGILVGIVIAWITMRWIRKVFNDALIEISLIIASAYLTFFIAERFFHVSGVLGLVALGLLMSSIGRTRISPQVMHFLREFWEIAAFIANTLIFIIVGVVIANDVSFTGMDLVRLLLLYIGVHIVRAIVIVLFYPAMKRVGYGLPRKDAVVLWYGALRGAVGLAMALMVAGEIGIAPEVREDFLFYTAGLVTLTLLINATTIPYVVKALGLTNISTTRRASIERVQKDIRARAEEAIEGYKDNRYLKSANWKTVSKYLPSVPQDEKEDERGHQSTLADIRMQLLAKEKEAYWSVFNHGFINSLAILKLEESVNSVMDLGGEHVFSARKDLEESWKVSPFLKRIQSWPVIGGLFSQLYFESLSTSLDEAKAYVIAQERCLELITSLKASNDEHGIPGEILEQLEDEVDENRIMGFTFLRNMRHFYPEMYRAVATRQATRAILNAEEDSVKQMRQQGRINKNESEQMRVEIEERMKKLQFDPPEFDFTKPEELLRELPWLKTLPSGVFDQVLEAFQTRLFPHGAMLIEENDASDEGLYVIVRGKVKVEIREVTMDILGVGGILGEMAVLTGYPRTATVTAATPVEAVWIDRKDMQRIMKDSKELENSLWEFASMRFAMNLLSKQEPFTQWEQNKFIQWLSMGEIKTPNENGKINLQGKIGVLVTGTAALQDASEIVKSPATLSGNKYEFSKDARVFVRDQ